MISDGEVIVFFSIGFGESVKTEILWLGNYL